MIVARDAAHAKLRERLEDGQGLPDYFKNHPVYYAGPAKTPDGYASGAFGPTTAGRMDSFVARLPEGRRLDGDAGQGQPLAGGDARRASSTAASISPRSAGRRPTSPSTASRRSRCVEYPELGMEAIWRIEVEDFPAFIVIDDKGNDFFKELNLG